jgi:hypothetical protein
MKTALVQRPLINLFQPAWWIEIHTQRPACTYYFGPFDNEQEAKLSQPGFIDDLLHEKAQGITAELKQGCPKQLTIADDG